MTACVLDASALLALLLDEPGGAQVGQSLDESAITAVNLCEVVGYLARRGLSEAQIRELLAPLPIEQVPFDERLAYEAGLLLPATRAAGLSLGDRACLAFARQRGLPALTADRTWSAIAAAIGVTVTAIRA